LFESIEKVLCEGPYMASRIRNLGCPGYKVVVHRLGVPVQDIEFQERPWWLRSELRVLLAGSFFFKKGIPVALEALGKLKSEIPFFVTVIGDSNGSPSAEAEKAKIMEIIRRYDLAGKVELLGIKRYSELVQAAYSQDVFIAASRTAPDGDTEGGAPVTLLDMAASGIPLISTRHCDIPEIVRHGITGTLAEENSSESLAEAIRWFSRNRPEAARMARAARALVEREFDARIQSCKLSRLYLGEVPEKSVEN
jgi:colanic acid/amylovoran biosynthesis glycosyltransferase